MEKPMNVPLSLTPIRMPIPELLRQGICITDLIIDVAWNKL